ncbi:MAG: pitrilysin family protein [Candidatus Brocadiia bacterium]
MKKSLLTILAAVCVYLGTVGVWASDMPNLDVKEYVLNNGMKVLVLERFHSPTVSCRLFFKVGSINEQDGQTGISHLLEHMLGRGTDIIGTTDYQKEKVILDKIDKAMLRLEYLKKVKAAQKTDNPIAEDGEIKSLEDELKGLYELHRNFVIPQEYDQIYKRNGATGLNASTNKNMTTYYCSLPSNKLELWMWLESDHIINPVFRGLYEERNTVLEERNTRSEDDPDGIFWEEFDSLFYKASPLKRPIIGWRSDIAALSKQNLIDYFHLYYAPNNAVAVIVGAVKAEDVLRLMKKYFEPIPAGKPIPQILTVEPQQFGERRVTIEFDAEPKMMIGYKGATIGDKADYTMDIMSQILSGGRTSRFYKKLVLEKKMCLDIDAFNSAGRVAGIGEGWAPGYFGVYAVPKSDTNLAELEKAIYDELELLKTEPVTDEEMQKAENNLEASFLRQLNSNEGLASSLGSDEIISGSWRYIIDWLPNCRKVTKEDIMKVAQQYFIPSQKTVAVMVRKPETSEPDQNKKEQGDK